MLDIIKVKNNSGSPPYVRHNKFLVWQHCKIVTLCLMKCEYKNIQRRKFFVSLFKCTTLPKIRKKMSSNSLILWRLMIRWQKLLFFTGAHLFLTPISLSAPVDLRFSVQIEWNNKTFVSHPIFSHFPYFIVIFKFIFVKSFKR